MTPRLQILLIVLVGMSAFTACKNPQVAQKSGTQFETDADGKFDTPTYVSPEEYERMTPQERQRLNAHLGVEASVQYGGEVQSSPRDVPYSKLDKAMSNAQSDSVK